MNKGNKLITTILILIILLALPAYAADLQVVEEIDAVHNDDQAFSVEVVDNSLTDEEIYQLVEEDDNFCEEHNDITFETETELHEGSESESVSSNEIVDENALLGATESSLGTVISTGSCGRYVKYTLYDSAGDGSGDSLIISGEGEMYDSSMPWIGTSGNPNMTIKSVRIDYGVTHIGNRAFAYCGALEGVRISDSVSTIGSYAFSGCKKLSEITLPGEITVIDNYLFSDCISLSKVSIWGQVTSIGNAAFSGCSSLSQIRLPDSLEKIGSSAFFYCTNLETLVIPDKVSIIADHAFSGCSNLKNITLPLGITCIENGMFNECSKLETINIPANVERIKANAFTGCKGLMEVNMSEIVSTIDNYAFYNCDSLKSVTLPLSISSIGTMAIGYHYNQSNRTNIPIDGFIIYGYKNTVAQSYAKSNNIKFVELESPGVIIQSNKCGDSAFYTLYDTDDDNLGDYLEITGSGNMYDTAAWPWNGSYDAPNSSLTKISIGSKITSVGNGAFQYCTGLNNITLPDGLLRIGSSAFLGCSSLESITIPAYIKTIDNITFEGCTGLKNVILPNGLEKINYSAFGYCKSLEIVTIPDSVSYMGEFAFVECERLYSINIPKQVATLREGIFDGCINLTNVYIPSNVKCIDVEAYRGCKGITSLTLSEGIEEIRSSAFSGCSMLEKVTIPASVTNIGYMAFNKCNSLKRANIPATVKNIGDYSFGYSDKEAASDLLTIYGVTGSVANKYAIDNDIAFIDENASGYIYDQGKCGDNLYYSVYDTDNDGYGDRMDIYGQGRAYDYEKGKRPWYDYCEKITSLKFEDGITYIGNYMFKGFSNIESAELPITVKEVGHYAFSGCLKLNYVQLNEGVSSIGDYAFLSCSNLGCVDFPSTLNEIGKGAFNIVYYDSGRLKEVYIPSSVSKINETALGYLYGNVRYDDFTIYGVSGTEAERYANDNNITFIAITPKEYRINYILNGGVNNAENPDHNVSSHSLFLKEPTRRGYRFEGWYKEYSLENPIRYIPAGVSNYDVDVFAKWSYLYEEKGYELSLGTNLDLKYILNVSNLVIEDKDTYVEYRLGNIVNKVKLEAYGDNTAFVCSVPAKNISDTISATLFSKGTAYELSSYSVEEYLREIINNDTGNEEYNKASNVAKSILNYGAYAQQYFGYDKEGYSNEGLYESGADPVKLLSNDEVTNGITSSFGGKSSNSDFTYIGASLVCNSGTDLNVYFKNKKGYDVAQIEDFYRVSILGADDCTITISNKDDLMCVKIEDIPVMRLGNVYTISMRNGYDNISYSFSPMDYIKKSMDTDNEKLINLCKALYLYKIAAEEYYM